MKQRAAAVSPVPASHPDVADRLAEWLAPRRRLFVLTGAGVSTESGIPGYRDSSGEWTARRPMEYREFAGSAAARRRYWARSLVGWRRVAAAEPNAGHRALARLEALGRVRSLVTQNVDGLHQKAGSRRVTDLHGRLDRVECLGCRITFPRASLQAELARLNPGWEAIDARFRPDGDAVPLGLGEAGYDAFRVPSCPSCGGVLKPWVVFFGESVPRPRTRRVLAEFDAADGLLVVGSSLAVASGYRFARAAARRGLPFALVNLGRTRADAEAGLRVEAASGEVLPQVVARLGGG